MTENQIVELIAQITPSAMTLIAFIVSFIKLISSFKAQKVDLTNYITSDRQALENKLAEVMAIQVKNNQDNEELKQVLTAVVKENLELKKQVSNCICKMNHIKVNEDEN